MCPASNVDLGLEFQSTHKNSGYTSFGKEERIFCQLKISYGREISDIQKAATEVLELILYRGYCLDFRSGRCFLLQRNWLWKHRQVNMTEMAGFLTDEQRKTMSTVFQGRSPFTEAATLVKPVANHIPKSNGSSGETKGLSVGHGLEPKRERRSHSGKNGRPKKGA